MREAEISKIQLTYRLSCEFLSLGLGYPVDTGDDALNILCLEGAQPLSALPGLIRVGDNLPDRYNDSVVLFWRDASRSADKQGRLQVLRSTTEPGRFYTENPMNPRGAAHLVWGHHLYKRGKHRGRRALVSASGRERVWRDKDADFTRDVCELVEEGRFGIHLHAGGEAESVGRWSAGCIAVYGGYEGEAYQGLLRRMDAHPGRLFRLTLWSGHDLARWVKDRQGWRPLLRLGIRGPWVSRMQKLLNQVADAGLVVDSDWGPSTQKVFLEFQVKAGLAVDGVCGPLSWQALEDEKKGGIGVNQR